MQNKAPQRNWQEKLSLWLNYNMPFILFCEPVIKHFDPAARGICAEIRCNSDDVASPLNKEIFAQLLRVCATKKHGDSDLQQATEAVLSTFPSLITMADKICKVMGHAALHNFPAVARNLLDVSNALIESLDPQFTRAQLLGHIYSARTNPIITSIVLDKLSLHSVDNMCTARPDLSLAWSKLQDMFYLLLLNGMSCYILINAREIEKHYLSTQGPISSVFLEGTNIGNDTFMDSYAMANRCIEELSYAFPDEDYKPDFSAWNQTTLEQVTSSSCWKERFS